MTKDIADAGRSSEGEPDPAAEPIPADEPKPRTATKPRAAPSKPRATPSKASVECSSGVKSYVRVLLAPGGGPVVRLVVKASPSGSLSAGGDSPASDAADKRLRGASAAKVQKYAGEGLPCHFKYEWAQGD